MFDYEPLAPENAPRGVVGIPRVLNMYENFPFWATFFKELGYSVMLSPKSSHKIYEMGIESIPSESECYPAKISHGHIEWLLQNGAKFIFYPCIPYERNETPDANNHYNCPIVATYPEVIAGNMDDIFQENKVTFSHPFLPYDNDAQLERELYKMLLEGTSKNGISMYLNEHGIPSPSAYRRIKGLPVASTVNDNPMWSARMIHEILTNEIYTGDLVQGRHRVKSYKVHQIEAVPEEDWVRVPNTHEAIIDLSLIHI